MDGPVAIFVVSFELVRLSVVKEVEELVDDVVFDKSV